VPIWNRNTIVNWEMLFIIGSLIFAVVVIVGANIWALRDAPVRGLEVSLEPLSKEIRELLETEPREV
jgi:hypothetical protein